jgi:glycosyltransferase involved in cell wall biosynthesis
MAHADLLIYCPLSHGGVAEHAHYQARALHRLGVRVCVLAAKDFLQGRDVPYPVERILPTAPAGKPGLQRRIRHALWLAALPWLLAARIWRTRPASVLLGSYSEYLSPFWIWPHLVLRGCRGVRYGANLHDPVRDFQLGPRWWHRLSVRLAYEGLDYAIVHQTGYPAGTVPPHVKVYEAPVGVYDIATRADPSGAPERSPRLAPDASVLLCFGHIRDNKNIDLLIRALPAFPNLHLVVAGPEPASGQRPMEYYREVAREAGVAGRIHLDAKFIADEDIASYFAKADWIAVTYAASFHSQSGVLNIAARARKQVLASSGPSPLRMAVERYGLGVFVEPDSPEAVVRGLRTLMDNPPVPDWRGYEDYASWTRNAKVIMFAAGVEAAGKPG